MKEVEGEREGRSCSKNKAREEISRERMIRRRKRKGEGRKREMYVRCMRKPCPSPELTLELPEAQ